MNCKAREFIATDRFSMADIVALTTIDFATFIGIETPEELANLHAWHARVSRGRAPRPRKLERKKEKRQGSYPCRRNGSNDFEYYGLLGVPGAPAAAAPCSSRKFFTSSVLLPSTSLYAWPGLTLKPLLSPEMSRWKNCSALGAFAPPGKGLHG